MYGSVVPEPEGRLRWRANSRSLSFLALLRASAAGPGAELPVAARALLGAGGRREREQRGDRQSP